MKRNGLDQVFAASGVRLSRVFSLSAACRLAGLSALLFAAGCGNQYRPVLTGTNPVGPAGQPIKYAVVLANTGSATAGLLTFVDFSGDTVISTPSVQVNATYLALNSTGGIGYTVNPLGTLDTFGTSNPAGLRTVDVSQTTLPANATDPNQTNQVINPIALGGSSGASLFIPEPPINSALGRVAALNSNGGLVQEVTLPGTPVWTVGVDNTPRVYAISTTGTSTPGVASAVESSTGSGLNVSAAITVGTDPDFGVMDAGARRAYILNRGSQNITVLNVVNNTVDTGFTPSYPTLPSSSCPATPVQPAGTIALPNIYALVGGQCVQTASAANPVWADFNPATNVLAVLSAGNGTLPGVLSLINIPLCNSATLPSNPACSTTNPVDAVGFGTVLSQAPVGVNAVQVSVLRDPLYPRAYVANGGSATVNGSVSIVDLNSGVTTGTLPTTPDTASYANSAVFGLHPNSIAATVGDPTGKVYVTAQDSQYVTVIQTDTEKVRTHMAIFGTGKRVVMTAP